MMMGSVEYGGEVLDDGAKVVPEADDAACVAPLLCHKGHKKTTLLETYHLKCQIPRIECNLKGHGRHNKIWKFLTKSYS